MPTDTYNYTNISTINKIEFCVFSNEEVKRYSVINEQLGITIPEVYDNGEPKQGGLNDKRLGITDQHLFCDTCGLMTNDCPGHFGHTELAEEVFHFGYLDLVKNVLNCVCLSCSKLLISKDEDEIYELLGNSIGKNRFSKIKKLTSNIKYCNRSENNCGKPVGKISKEITKSGSLQLTVAYMIDTKLEGEDKLNTALNKKKKNIEILTPSKVYIILKNISDNDYKLLGFDPLKNRPESFIIKNFPIPPVAIRPSVRLEMLSSGPSEDGLTAKLADIVKDNGRLKKQKEKSLIIGEESKYNKDYHQLLQYDIATYYDNDSVLPKSEQKGSSASKSVSERLKGKTGRIRGNLMGKRVDFSARTVITPDPNLSLDELGVPIKIAMNLTFPEIVTEFNIDKLTQLVRNGRDVYPGANFILPYNSLKMGKKLKIDLRYRKRSIKLHFGDIVERHIIDNDPVLFNRQPSLHKMSMMCHKIKVIKDELLNTFRLNVTVTTPYNADFDGDEMNLFMPQSVQTQIELANIADVKRQIISPRYSKPIIKFKQDTLLGTYKMTNKIKQINYNDAMNLAMYCSNVNKFKIKKENITIHELYSLIIPDLINYNNEKISIINGKISKGVINEYILNEKIVYYSWDRHGPEITKNFFDNSQRLVTNWLLMNGFTVGLGDATTDKETLVDIQSLCHLKQMEINKLITEMENNPDTLDTKTFEINLTSQLSASNGEITKKVMDHIKANNPDNNFYIMIDSKAKGKIENIGNIMGALGQNVLDGKRIKKKVNNRTLPHFFQNDDRAFARGYIKNSYYHGLTPQEFFFHHLTAREGMIDTALKTSDSGYLQRKLIKGMEDIFMAYDKTIRSGNNVIIQMIYGDNGISQTFFKEIEIKLVSMSNTDINNLLIFTNDELENLLKEFKLDKDKLNEWNNNFYKYMKELRDNLRDIQMKANLSYITMQNMYQLPINLLRIIDDAKNINVNTKKDRLNPLYIIHAIKYILKPENTKINIIDKNYDINSFKYKDQDNSKYLLKIALFEYLSPKRCIFEYKLTKHQFDQIVIDIIESFKKACVEPGEMVGTLTAQSLGETLTQMSCIGSSKIFLKTLNKKTNITFIKKTTIGEFIEKLYNKFPHRIVNIQQFENSTEFSLQDLLHEYYICGVNNDEKVNWNKISHLSKHPTNGNLLKIKTTSGRTVITTKSHNFLKRSANDGIIAVSCDNLKLNDRIPVSRLIKYQTNNKQIIVNDFKFILDKNSGWLFGAYLVKGSLNNNQINISNISEEYHENMYIIGKILNVDINQCNINGQNTTTSLTHKELANIIRNNFKYDSFNKVVPEFVHNTNLDFIAGFLRGYFDGNIYSTKNIICISSPSDTIIQDISILLLYFGIFSSLYVEEKDTSFYCLNIPHKYAKTFLEKIGTDIKEKENNIKSIIEFSESEHQYSSEVIDKIPELGHIISRIGTKLKMPANSRTYGIWERKNLSIDRQTLKIYIDRFDIRLKELGIETDKDVEYLKLIYSGEVIWDAIIEITEIEDPKEYVYDFTVPNNETFMINEGIIVHNTLNSVSWDQQISYVNNDEYNIIKIGEMIDNLLKENNKNVLIIDNSVETEYLDISHLGYKIQSVDENGKMHWKLIEAITKHLPGGNVVKIKTLSGRSVVATKAKSFLIRRDNKLIDIEGSKIKIGDRLPIQKNAPILDKYLEYEPNTSILLDINYAHELAIKLKQNKNEFPFWLFIANNNFIEEFLITYMINNDINNVNILLSICELYSRLGQVFNTITKIINNDNNIIPGVNIGTLYGDYSRFDLQEIYNTTTDLTIKELLRQTLDEDVYYDLIIDIVDVPLENITPGHNKVYDLTVADTRNFNMFGGLCMRDTFHSSGVGVKGMQGIPRFREILSYSKNIQTPYMIIKLIPEIRTNNIIAHKIEAYLKHTILKNLIEKMDIIYDPFATNILTKDNINKANIYYINSGNVDIVNLPWLFKLKISREAMLEYDITLLDIKTKFINHCDEYNNESLANKKKIIFSRIINGCIMSNFDNSENPIIHIRLDVNNPDNNTLIELGQYILNKISIKGVPNIELVDRVEKQKVIEYDDNKGIKTNASELVLYTTGIDLDKIKTIKYIDFDTIFINDIYMTYLNFGIEAARNLILYETNKLYNGSGNSLNITHSALLADIMTNTGNITSIDRHGINRLDTDPLSRASFENTVEHLITAAAFNEVDYMRSVSSRIMAGRCFKGGTGLCDILLDTELIENSEYNNTTNDSIGTTKNTIEINTAIQSFNKLQVNDDVFMP